MPRLHLDHWIAAHYYWQVDAVRTITIDRGDVGQRLDLVLQRHLRSVTSASRTRIQKWIEAGRVVVNHLPATRPAQRAAAGDVVSIAVPSGSARAVMDAEDLALEVIYEDEHLLAINKPAGMVAHPTYRHPQGTLMNALLWHARHWPANARPSLVGRLDRLTSGVVIVAKSRAVHATLQRILSAPRSEKHYLAVVYGRVKAARGTIDAHLSRNRQTRRTVIADSDSGSPSRTVFERMRSIDASPVGAALLRCRLMTGRTHQIRVHLAARGWPIVGDTKYGEPLWARVADRELGAVLRAFPRQALHAWRISFEHPVTRMSLICEAAPPDDFQRLLNDLNLR